MRSSLACSIFATTFKCIAASFAAGMLFNLGFTIIILLLSVFDRPAAAQEWLPPSEQIAVIIGNEPSPVAPGSICRASWLLHATTVAKGRHSSSQAKYSSQCFVESD